MHIQRYYVDYVARPSPLARANKEVYSWSILLKEENRLIQILAQIFKKMLGSGAQRNTTTEDEAEIGMPETLQEQPVSVNDSMIIHIQANPIQDTNLPPLTRVLDTEPGAANETPSRDQATNTSAGPAINTSAGSSASTLLIHQSDTTNSPPSANFSVSRQSYQESGLQQNTTVDSGDGFDLESIVSIMESDSGSSQAL